MAALHQADRSPAARGASLPAESTCGTARRQASPSDSVHRQDLPHANRLQDRGEHCAYYARRGCVPCSQDYLPSVELSSSILAAAEAAAARHRAHGPGSTPRQLSLLGTYSAPRGGQPRLVLRPVADEGAAGKCQHNLETHGTKFNAGNLISAHAWRPFCAGDESNFLVPCEMRQQPQTAAQAQVCLRVWDGGA